jgi:aldose 1-epimerase
VKRVTQVLAIIMAMATAISAVAKGETKMAVFGTTPDGVAVPIYTLTSGQIEVRVMAYGAHLVSVKAPDRNGKLADVVLGYDDLSTYLKTPNPYIGAIVGRYGNRIAAGQVHD